MCGIIGCCASSSIKDILINGLERLEYRGYDSSGISYIENGKIITYKSVGKLINLKNTQKVSTIAIIEHTEEENESEEQQTTEQTQKNTVCHMAHSEQHQRNLQLSFLLP